MFCALQEPVLTYDTYDDETGPLYPAIEAASSTFNRELARHPTKVKAVFEHLIHGPIAVQRWWAINRHEMYAAASPDTVTDFWHQAVRDENIQVLSHAYHKLTRLWGEEAEGVSSFVGMAEDRLRRAGLTLLQATRLTIEAGEALWTRRDAVAATAMHALIEHPQPPEPPAAPRPACTRGAQHLHELCIQP